jgi:hypothetical protein
VRFLDFFPRRARAVPSGAAPPASAAAAASAITTRTAPDDDAAIAGRIRGIFA